jgi:hypothetical protein
MFVLQLQVVRIREGVELNSACHQRIHRFGLWRYLSRVGDVRVGSIDVG